MLRFLTLFGFCVWMSSQTTHYFRYGETLTLVCQLNNSGSIIVWRKNNIIIADKKNVINPQLPCYKKYSVFSNDTFTSMLHINMADDCVVGGHYWCETTINEKIQSFAIVLKKIELPKSLGIINSDFKQMIHGTESKALDLICTVTSGIPKETLSWTFNGEVLVSDNTTDSLKYTIIPDRTFDYRVYTCQADGRYLKTPLKQNITLNIDYIPKVSVLVQPNSTVQEGTDVLFECIHDLNIIPIVIWSKDGEQISSFRSPQEYIHNITRTDTGLYSCAIMKNENQGFGKISLDILFSPDMSVINYNNGTLFCNATGNPSIYKYLQWEHRSSNNKHIRYVDGRKNGYLLIPNLTGLPWYSKSGIYTCSAENGIISNHKLHRTGSIQVDFEGTPACSRKDYYVYGILGQKSEIFFEVYSFPKYNDFQWKTSNFTITNTSTKYVMKVSKTQIETVFNDMQIEVSGWKFSLIIYDLIEDDIDYFTLQVMNEKGNTSCTFSLKHANERRLSPTMIYIIACGSTICVVLVMNAIKHIVIKRKTELRNLRRKPVISITDNITVL